MDKDVNGVMQPYKSTFFKVAIAESVLAVILVLTALSLKFFAPETYRAAKKWYAENAMVDVDIKEFVSEAEDAN